MISRKNRNGPEKPVGRIAALVVLLVLLGGGVLFGVACGIGFLRDLWHEQCRVDDPELDIVITTGKMVHPDVVTMHFGLTNGANLATIPFEELRLRLLENVPNIRDIHIERRLPNRVMIDVAEREPVVRVAFGKGPPTAGRVADLEGVVFRSFSNSALLPIVRESGDAATPPGKRLTGAAFAALQLVEAASQPETVDLRVQEIDTKKKDYLLLTLGNGSTAHIAWDHMGDTTQASRASLRRQLSRLAKAVSSRISPRSTRWIATDFGTPGRIYANDPARSGQ